MLEEILAIVEFVINVEEKNNVYSQLLLQMLLYKMEVRERKAM